MVVKLWVENRAEIFLSLRMVAIFGRAIGSFSDKIGVSDQ